MAQPAIFFSQFPAFVFKGEGMSPESSGGGEKSLQQSCGLIMPISALDGCGSEHWAEVKNIICESIETISSPNFVVKMVSDADDVGVIQKRIVQNIYSSDIVICDVSGKNPNVMFELGMRLAFDKPTVIIKDDKTDYSFDTGIIEHIPYPRDLRFPRMVAFKSQLADKVIATYRAAKSDPAHSTFLKNFGKFQVASLSETIVPADKIVIEMLNDVQLELSRLRRASGMRDLSLKKPGFDAVAAIASGLNAYIAKNPDKKISEIKDERFYEEMENLCNAPKYFDGPVEFRSALDDYLMVAARQELNLHVRRAAAT